MGLAWQQGPLASGAVGHFLTPQPMPERILYAEPLRRRMRVKFGDQYIADSEDVVLLHEPGRYPVAYFPRGDVQPGVLIAEERVTQHRDLGETRWLTVSLDGHEANHAAWEYSALPEYAAVLGERVAFAWRAMDAFYEEDERIVGHAADFYHRIDVRSTSRHLVVRDGDRVIADTDPEGTVVWIEREPGASGKAYIDHVRNDVLPDKAVYEDRVSGDKVTRAMPAAS